MYIRISIIGGLGTGQLGNHEESWRSIYVKRIKKRRNEEDEVELLQKQKDTEVIVLFCVFD